MSSQNPEIGERGNVTAAARWPRVLSLIVFVYLALGAQYALLTPAWQVPDEPAHYNVIAQIAATGRLPQLEPGDYDQAYLERLTAERFPPALSLARVQYQDYQPPLYYLIATPVFWLSGGALAALRLLSVALGAGVIVFAFLAVRALTGPASLLPVSAAGFIAFVPQHVAMLAGVNNDSLSELWVALGLWLLVAEVMDGAHGRPHRPLGPWALGLVLGLAFITKVWAYVLAPAALVALLLQWRRAGWRQWRPMAGRAAQIFGPALLIGAVYWGRNWFVCGPLDFLCGRWHNQVVLGQPRTTEWLARYGWDGYVEQFARTTFQSFWGQFGWMGVVMDQRIYAALLAFTLVLAVGVGLAWVRRRADLTPPQRDGLGVLATVAVVTLALYLFYNTTFVQFQGRYLFVALVPLGLAAAASLRAWGDLAQALARRRIGWWIPLGALLALAALCALALYRFILPALA